MMRRVTVLLLSLCVMVVPEVSQSQSENDKLKRIISELSDIHEERHSIMWELGQLRDTYKKGEDLTEFFVQHTRIQQIMGNIVEIGILQESRTDILKMMEEEEITVNRTHMMTSYFQSGKSLVELQLKLIEIQSEKIQSEKVMSEIEKLKSNITKLVTVIGETVRYLESLGR